MSSQVRPSTHLSRHSHTSTTRHGLLINIIKVLTSRFSMALTIKFLSMFRHSMLFTISISQRRMRITPRCIISITRLLMRRSITTFRRQVRQITRCVCHTITFQRIKSISRIRKFNLHLVHRRQRRSHHSLSQMRQRTLRQRQVIHTRSMNHRIKFNIRRITFTTLRPFKICIRFLGRCITIPNQRSNFPHFSRQGNHFTSTGVLDRLFLHRTRLFSCRFCPHIRDFWSRGFVSGGYVFQLRVRVLGLCLYYGIGRFVYAYGLFYGGPTGCRLYVQFRLGFVGE